mmetsp:Transcript_58775/g.149151  ORF Transcript_58775/g.149151 Transcript_58775/m.149151 type:complete len:224 (+) Transcript_58775:104-775(+)
MAVGRQVGYDVWLAEPLRRDPGGAHLHHRRHGRCEGTLRGGHRAAAPRLATHRRAVRPRRRGGLSVRSPAAREWRASCRGRRLWSECGRGLHGEVRRLAQLRHAVYRQGERKGQIAEAFEGLRQGVRSWHRGERGERQDWQNAAVLLPDGPASRDVFLAAERRFVRGVGHGGFQHARRRLHLQGAGSLQPGAISWLGRGQLCRHRHGPCPAQFGTPLRRCIRA